MSAFSLLPSLLACVRGKPASRLGRRASGRTKAGRKSVRSAFLRVELLEDRVLPSGFPPLVGPANPPAAANAVVSQVVGGSTKILTAGYDTINGNQEFALWRYNS